MDRPLDVVLVEDDRGDAFLVEEMLRDADPRIEVHWYRSIAEAGAELATTTGCVLLDLNLPDATGLDGLRTVIRRAPHASIVVLTGLNDRQIGLQALAAGAEDYLVKGEADGPLLSRSVRYARERKRADEAARSAHEAELRSEENSRLERGLLPRPLLLDGNVECVVRYRPGGGRMLLGGDFYDTVQTADGQLHVMIGDVCGHGPDEAALGVNLRMAWRTLILAGLQPERVLSTLNTVLESERNAPGVFVTLCYLSISPDHRTARQSIAGHPGPLLLEPEIAELPTPARGPALGLVPDARWPVDTVSLPPGWTLMLYTDGLVEGRVPDSTSRLGTEGLVEILAPLRRLRDKQEVAETVIAHAEKLNGGPLVDDVALLVISHTEPDPGDPAT